MDDHEVEESPGQEPLQEGSSDPKSEPLEGSQEEKTKPKKNVPDSQSGKEGDALAWFEGPAFDSPIDEMPTLRWPEDRPPEDMDDFHEQATSTNMQVGEEPNRDTVEPINDLDEAMVWLENLADGQGTPIDEMPTLISRKSDEDLVDPSGQGAPLELDQGTMQNIPTDSDPMAWLEQLAVDQNSPLEELPSVANRLLASDIASQASNGATSKWQSAEVEEALTYLEQVAISEGVTFDDISFQEEQVTGTFEEQLLIIDRLAGATRPEDAIVEVKNENWDDLSDQMPDDPDEALAWLSEFSDEDQDESLIDEPDLAIAVAESEMPDETDNSQASLPEQDDSAVDDQFLEEMPDDPDEAMSWMKGLADQKDVPSKESKISKEPDQSEPVEKINISKREDLKKTREAYLEGDQSSAVQQYRDLINKGDEGSALIDELENFVAENPEDPQLYQLLGDAYMKEGHLQKALKAYKQQLAHS